MARKPEADAKIEAGSAPALCDFNAACSAAITRGSRPVATLARAL